jgi:hypothetical protein
MLLPEDIAEELSVALTPISLSDNGAYTAPTFVSRWHYDTTYLLDDKNSDSPVDVLFVPKSEDLEQETRTNLDGNIEIDIAIRKKLNRIDRDEIEALRVFADKVFYHWVSVRLPITDATLVKTNIVALYVVEDLLSKLCFFSVATLTFEATKVL